MVLKVLLCASVLLILVSGMPKSYSPVQCPTEPGEYPVMFGHPNDCQHFFMCSNGVPSPLRCADDTRWSEEDHMCVSMIPSDKRCGPFRPEADRVSKSHPNVPNRCPFAPDEYPVFYGLQDDCQQFVMCTNGIAHLFRCADGTRWDEDSQMCVEMTPDDSCKPKSHVKNVPQDSINFNPCLLSTDVSWYSADPNNCQQFFVCSNGEAQLMRCADGTKWNDETQECIEVKSPKDACGTAQPAPWRVSQNRGPNRCPSVSGKHPFLYANPSDCHEFFMCNHGVPNLLRCADGTRWSDSTKTCTEMTSPDESCSP